MSEQEEEVVRIKPLYLENLIPSDDPSTWKDTGGAIYLIIGESGSGKSRIIQALTFAKKHIIPACVAVSESEVFNSAYKPIIPQLFIYEKNTPDIIERIQARQLIAKKELTNPWLTLILDDCMNKSSNFTGDKQIELFKTSRHQNMYVLISCQYSFDLQPKLRDQCAGFFILRCDNEENRTKIYRNYASIIPNRQLFNTLMDDLTKDYSCLFVNKRSSSQSWQDKVFRYKAPDLSVHNEWSAVSKDVKAYDEERFDKNYNPSLAALKKTGITRVV